MSGDDRKHCSGVYMRLGGTYPCEAGAAFELWPAAETLSRDTYLRRSCPHHLAQVVRAIAAEGGRRDVVKVRPLREVSR